MHNSGRTALKELREKLPLLRSVLQPQHIILFGSQARGDASEDSDIDVVIVSDRFEGVPHSNRHRALLRHIWRDRSVDVICLTPDEFERVRKWAGVISTACEEGIWL